MSKVINIAVLKDRYQTSFMTPRVSRNNILRKNFLPFNLISSKFEGMTMMTPGIGIDLVHAHNRIPLGANHFIMSFESHLPRRYAMAEDNGLTRYMQSRIESTQCRRIVAMSHFAKRNFLEQHADNPELARLQSKLMVRHPNVEISNKADALEGQPVDEIRLTFIGGHFGRKGGCVAVRVAELATQRKLPVRVTIISSLIVGGDVWTDPTVDGFFDPYLKLLELENVNFMRSQSNDVVRQTLANSHFSLLATFDDSFGYSAIESMAEHTPVIGTNVCALPEFIADDVNGILLPIPTSVNGQWINPGYTKRGEAMYADHYRDEVERLAEETILRLERWFAQPDTHAEMRKHARLTATSMFDAKMAASNWDELYQQVANEVPGSVPVMDPSRDFSSPEAYCAPMADTALTHDLDLSV